MPGLRIAHGQTLAAQALIWLVQFPALVKREQRETLQREIDPGLQRRRLRFPSSQSRSRGCAISRCFPCVAQRIVEAARNDVKSTVTTELAATMEMIELHRE